MMRRRDFLISGTSLTFAACSSSPPPQPQAIQAAMDVSLRIFFSGSIVFLPSKEGGNPYYLAALATSPGHYGRLLMHRSDLAAEVGSTPKKDDLKKWRLPETQANAYQEYRYWDLQAEFKLNANSNEPFKQTLNTAPTIVPMKTLAGEWDSGKLAGTTAWVKLAFGTLSPSYAKESAYGHDDADWEFKDPKQNKYGQPARMTDVVKLSAVTSQPEFELNGGQKVQTATKEVTAWIIQVPQNPSGDKKCAEHCASYYELVKTPPHVDDRKIPCRTTPFPLFPPDMDLLPPDARRTIDPIFCPPGSFDL
jgi:hypothetical protein